MSPPDIRSRTRGRQALGVASDDFLFAYFGRLYAGKGLETLLKAFARVRGRRPDVRLAIVGGVHRDGVSGNWSIESVHQLGASLGISDHVVWTGEYPWDSDEASTYLHAADAAVLPFRSGVHLNNSSLAGVAAHGLPLITTRGDVLEAPFRDGENVLLCPPEDPEELAIAMEKVLVDVDLRRRLGAGMATLAQEWLSWGASVERTVAAFSPVAPIQFDSPGVSTHFADVAVPGGRG
jgi:glycosyltransferase involved in cell wall biosynthesis